MQSASHPGSRQNSGDSISRRLYAYFSNAFKRQAEVDSSGKISTTARQIYIIPTRFGITFAAMVIAMLIGSNNYGINLGFMLTFVLTGMGFAAMLQTWQNLVHLEFTVGQAAPVFCGESARFPVTCYNNRAVARNALQLSLGDLPVSRDLLANSSVEFVCSVPASQRGILRPKRWTVFTYYPLGMFYAWAYFKTGQKCLVYPKPVNTQITIDKLFKSDSIGAQSNDDNMDFFGHSKYHSGDDLRRIDWKALARGKGYLIKHFLQQQDDRIWLNWNALQSSDVELKLSILCRAVLELSRANVDFGLKLPGVIIEPDSGKQHKADCLAQLALFEI